MIPMKKIEGMVRRIEMHGVPQLLWVNGGDKLDASPADTPRSQMMLKSPPRGFLVLGVFCPGISASELAAQVWGLRK